MRNLQNLHTHSTFCDGKNTPEEMVRFAIEKGFDSIGFSGHSYMSFSEGWSMSLSGTEDYKKHINELKEKFKNEIDIFLGLEFEMYSHIGIDGGMDLSGYDYLIGSSHYIKLGDEIVGFDRDAKTVKEVIDKYFGGNGLAFAKKYYEGFSKLHEYGNFDIIGHFDIITKTLDQIPHFDPECKEYLNAAFECIEALSGKIPFFEVNTGPIPRGYKLTPYPSKPLLKELKNKGFKAIITSDCHNGKDLDGGFETAREILKECGYSERYILTKNGFKAVNI